MYSNHYPEPSFELILEEYTKAIQPFITNEEYLQVYKDTKQYLEYYGDRLLALLEEHKKHIPKNLHYLNHHVIDGYCVERLPLPITSTYGVHLHTFDTHDEYSSLQFYAHSIYAVASLCHSIYMSNEMDNPILFCFGTCRVPDIKSDTIQRTTEPTHYIVYHAMRCYKIPLYDSTGVLYSEQSIYAMLCAIMKDTRDKNSQFLYVSYMGSTITSLFLEEFIHIESNARLFEYLETAQFSIIIADEDYTQADYTTVAYPFKYPIWTYTSCSLVLWKNKEITGYFEHTHIDGVTANEFLILLQKQYTHNVKRSLQRLDTSDIPYQYLPFVYTKELCAMIELYRTSIESLSQTIQTEVFILELNSIMQYYSADAFIQSMLQYILYSMEGQLSSVYEPVSMAQYEQGRVEVVRSVSSESVALIQHVYSSKVWSDSLARNAYAEHKRRITLCKRGEYFSRYLEVLASITKGTELQTLFQTKEYQLLGNDYLVTSNLGNNPYIKHFFYIREKDVRYNIGYCIQNGTATICFAYYNDYGLKEDIAKALYEYYTLCQQFCETNLKHDIDQQGSCI